MNDLIYLASYPKSGNTWFRAFITNLIKDTDEEVSINKMKTNGIYSGRTLFDSICGIKSSFMTPDEADILRPCVYKKYAEHLNQNVYIKVHDAYTYLPNGNPLIYSVNGKIIYILRNPLDVCVSFANHLNCSIEKSVKVINDENYCFCKNTNRLSDQLRQKLFSWSMHVKSFSEVTDSPIYFLRYEDMKLHSFNAFKGAVNFIGLDVSDEQIEEAVKLSDFKKLRKQEDDEGFRETPMNTKHFFRKGEIGDWKNYLSVEQVHCIIEYNKDIMRKYGYLDEYDNPVY